jgi:hypothetical protein
MDRYDWQRFGLLLGLFVIALYFWESRWLFPVKALVVFFHELGHGMAAVLTGGQIVKIELSPLLGGVCYHIGGSPTVTLPAGYLGSLAWGAFLLVASARTRLDRGISFLLGLFLITMTVIYVRSIFGLTMGILWGVFLMILGRLGSEQVNDALLQFLGLCSMLYAVVDIKDDLIDRTIAESDASRFAEIFGGSSTVWGVVWAVISIVAALAALRIALIKGHQKLEDPVAAPSSLSMSSGS